MSLNLIAKLRETMTARAESAGFPGLLPCAMTTDCQAHNQAKEVTDSGTPFHNPDFAEPVEVSEVLRRAGVRIAVAKNTRHTIVCRACTQWFHQREMWRDI